MASLNASGIPVVSKRGLSFRGYGRNIIGTENLNPFGQDSVRIVTIWVPPAPERSAADFGTQSSPAEESFLRHASFVKHAESVTDTTTDRILGGVAPDSGTQPEIALFNITTIHDDHRGGRIVEGDTAADSVIRRVSNIGVRPGGEI